MYEYKFNIKQYSTLYNEHLHHSKSVTLVKMMRSLVKLFVRGFVRECMNHPKIIPPILSKKVYILPKKVYCPKNVWAVPLARMRRSRSYYFMDKGGFASCV